MKLFPYLLITAVLAGRVLAIDAAGLAAVAAKFADPSGDAQYAARIELNVMLDKASVPGQGDRAAATRAVAELLAKAETPAEAKKYLLRALARIGTAEAVQPAAALFGGSDAILKEEARLVLESLGEPAAVAVLAEALAKTTDKSERLGLLGSLAINRATAAVPAIAAYCTDKDAEIARAAVAALAGIGGSEAIAALEKARADAGVAAAVKPDIEKAVLLAAAGDRAKVEGIYQSSASAGVKLQAFLALCKGEVPAALLAGALKSDDALLRMAALRQAVATSQMDLFPGGLAAAWESFSKDERLAVFPLLGSVKPREAAVELAIARLKSGDRDERVAALTALGELGGKPAMDAVLEALGSKEPAINQAAGLAIAGLDAPGADEALLGQLQGPAGPGKLLAIKATAYRALPGMQPILRQLVQDADKDTAQEAMKIFFAIGGIDDLKAFCATATAATEPQAKAALVSFCKRLATRLGTDEAKQLAEGLKAE